MNRKRKQIGWNEFNTFSKLIFPYLEENLGYPPRKSVFFDEQTWVRKRGERSGPYDGAFKDDRGVLVLIEAKKQGHNIGKAEINQAFDYCLGDTFSVPPPYVLVSNGETNLWFRRHRSTSGEYSYGPCDAVRWKKARQESGSGELVEQLTLKQLISLLSKSRKIIYHDLIQTYFPKVFSLKNNKLGKRKSGFEDVLRTRKSFVDSSLEDAAEKKAIQFVLSSIALSITLKILFVKIMSDRTSDIFPKAVKDRIKKLAKDFPGILIARPYDVLEISKECEIQLENLFKPISILQGLIFETSENPIGDIWDGLVVSEEHDLQVKSLGNVYTPDVIVKSMVDSAEAALGGWRGKNILEPSCGSGHFVREVYKRLRDTYLHSESGAAASPVTAHLEAMKHLKAVDIDPFAVQTTQLGMFLELYRSQNVWKAIAPKGKFNFSSVVDRADFLDRNFYQNFYSRPADLVIGNPPYGIAVHETISKQFRLGSPDSYGCFIAQAMRGLALNGRLLFIVSSTFLTARTHLELRSQILLRTRLKAIYLLHRNAFPRDVFPCILDLEKRSRGPLENYSYSFFDAWPIKPTDPDYEKGLKIWSKGESNDISEEKLKIYKTPISLVCLRKLPPSQKSIDKIYEEQPYPLLLNRNMITQIRVYPFFSGAPKIQLFCSDSEFGRHIRSSNQIFPILGNVDSLEVIRKPKSVGIVKLWQISKVLQGMSTADDEKFLRISPGIIPNARRRNLKVVNLANCLSEVEVNELSDKAKRDGIPILDVSSDKYFVPYDKGGEQDTEGGNLRAYWSPVDYWIDWSEEAVTELKRRERFKPGTNKKAYLRNSSYYFRRGVRFTRAGLYAPMFEVSFGAIFSDKGSLIIPNHDGITNFLLAILCHPITKYIAKNYLQHSVMTEIDAIRQIPIPIPTEEEFNAVSNLVSQILEARRNSVVSAEVEAQVNDLVFNIFGLDENEKAEITLWARRRYPLLGRGNRSSSEVDGDENGAFLDD